jgi:predicted ATPase
METIGNRLGTGHTRLITLIGTAGAGKTRLAIEVADRFGHRFQDGVCFVGLETVRDPDELPAVIAREVASRDGLARLAPDPR